jgi:hypothetical protein
VGWGEPISELCTKSNEEYLEFGSFTYLSVLSMQTVHSIYGYDEGVLQVRKLERQVQNNVSWFSLSTCLPLLQFNQGSLSCSMLHEMKILAHVSYKGCDNTNIYYLTRVMVANLWWHYF